MQNKRTLMKVGAGAVVATAIAGTIIAIQSGDDDFNGIMSAQDYEYMSYVTEHGKSYSTKAEFKLGQSNWAAQDDKINAHNADPNATSTCGHNFMSDYNPTELKNMKGYNVNANDMFGQPTSITFMNESSTDVNIDWVNTESDQQYQYNVLQHGESYTQETYIGDEWKVYNSQSRAVMMEFQAAADHIYTIGSAPAPTPTPTPSGGGGSGGGSSPGAAGEPIDWETRGMVTGIQNQQQCGGCWSFSAAGCIGSRRAIAGYPLTDYSEQQLIDCSGSYGNNGCGGGIMESAFEYVEVNPLETTANYPYKAANGTCTYSKSLGTGAISGYKRVQANSVNAMKTALQTGPVSVAVDASQTAFQSYKTGIVTSGCGTSLDHGIMAVGWGTTNGTEYFLVKNQWGATWGDNGYIKIGAQSSNVCGILSNASYVTVA